MIWSLWSSCFKILVWFIFLNYEPKVCKPNTGIVMITKEGNNKSCYSLLKRCVRKMNLSFILHILNILAISKIFLPLITPRVQFFRLLGVAVVV